MKIIYTVHALKRLKERKISVKEVKICIDAPDKIDEDKCGNFRYMKIIDGKLLVVICRKDKERGLIVITAFKTTRVEKYLGQLKK